VQSLNLGAPAANLSATLPDGRMRYGSVRQPSKAAFGDVLWLTDTKQGYSESYSITLRRNMKNRWAASISWAHNHSTDVSPMTSSVAFSNFSGRTYTNPNENVASKSNYNTPDKIVASIARQFDFFNNKRAMTTVSAVYRGQTGHNYSYVFFNDVNGDGLSGADLFYMPSGPTDSKVTFATQAQSDAFFAYAQANGLDRYAGQIVPRNAFNSPWQQTIDLHVSQNIPVGGRFTLEVFADVLNFANLFKSSWGVVEGVDFPYTRGIASATVAADGSSYTYTFGNVPKLTTFTELSRWQLQIGARFKF
jgi:hypothetical protein